MPSIEERIVALLDERRQDIVDFAQDIYEHPELGFKEHRTAAKVSDALTALGLNSESGLAITGVKAHLGSGGDEENRLTVAVLGELDAVRSPSHPNADPVTKAAHACGHHVQLAALYGAAIALTDPEVRAALGGDVVFFAVPSEEYGEIEFKTSLADEGKLKLLGGKPELVRIGAFDDIDVVISHHVEFDPDGVHRVVVGSGSSNGFVSKLVRFTGLAAHAAGSPHLGVNALNAATIGLTALNAQRETFRDQDAVRVHPIITKGGDLVNVVPSDVTVEALVRARTLDAVLDANVKTNRAFEAGASAVGATVEIIDQPGYLPTIPLRLDSPILEAASRVVGRDAVQTADPDSHGSFSTDVGDLTHLLPVLSFRTGGVGGSAHAADAVVLDVDEAYLLPAKVAALAVYELLKDGAARAKKLTDDFEPALTKAGYLDYLDSIVSSENGANAPASSSAEETISKATAVAEVRKACFHFADLYFHFSKTLIDELGLKKGKELIERSVRSRAVDRGTKLRATAEALGIAPTNDNFYSVTDIPFLGWDTSLGREHCPYAAAWLARYDEEPWFPEIAAFYCDVNDPLVSEVFTGDTTHTITKNVLRGDDICDRVYFPIEEKAEPRP